MTTYNTPAFTKALLSGAFAGMMVDISLYPLDTLKTRLQSSSGFLASGGFTGVYRGVGSAIIGSAPGAALFFCMYEISKSFLSAHKFVAGTEGRNSESWTLAVEHMFAASLGEIAACGVRVPTEVIKQRAQAGQQASSLLVLKAILCQHRTIGLPGVWMELYRGWSATVLREVPFTIIQFPLWEAMKEYQRRVSGNKNTTSFESALFGSIAGAIAASVTTPLDVLKTRMMLETEKTSMPLLFKQILNQSGPKAFFTGIGPRVLWISAGGAIFLGSYQWAYNCLFI